MKELVFQQRQVVSRLAMVAVCLAAGCASPHHTTTWTDPSYSGPPFAAILVVANPEDGGVRAALEDEIVGRLRDAGVAACAAHPFLPAGAPADGAAVRSVGARLAVDAILTVHLQIGARVERSPERVTVVPAVTYWGSPGAAGRPPFASYTRATNRPVDTAALQVALQGVARAGVVWSATSEAFNPRDARQVGVDIAALVVEALRKSSVIQAPV
jgi:hypothetical protein